MHLAPEEKHQAAVVGGCEATLIFPKLGDVFPAKVVGVFPKEMGQVSKHESHISAIFAPRVDAGSLQVEFLSQMFACFVGCV